jgi:hypothetical protein
VATRISRRTVLAGGASLAATTVGSCSWVGTVDPPARQPSPTVRRAVVERNAAVRADVALRDAAVVAERRLLELCEATARRHPSTAQLLRPVRQGHRAHVRVLEGLWRAPTSQPPAADHGRVPADRRSALADLRRAEQRVVDARLADCLDARVGELAALLASIAASDAQHVSLLAAP